MSDSTSSADYEAARGNAALFDVSDRGKVELSGPEAPSFAHNLSTNDILNLPLGGGCEAFFTTAKAKVVAYVLIFHVRLGSGKNALWIDVGPGQAQRLVEHLNRFLIAEQVEIADRTGDFAQLHLAGPRSKIVLESAVGEPIPDLGLLQHMERTIGSSATCNIRRNDPLGLPGYDIVCLPGRADEVRNALLSAGARAGGPDAYEILRIEAGTPVYGADIDENRFAVEVGRPHAISYTKGCYLGQEPIVMARDRAGHVNRAFRGFRLGEPVNLGSKLVAPDGKEVGLLTSTITSPRLGPIGLGYVRRGFEQAGTALSAEGTTAVVADLPMSA